MNQQIPVSVELPDHVLAQPAKAPNLRRLRLTSCGLRGETGSKVCASCHARMDPIGFALEKFDGIGRWRTTEFDAPIDSAAVLPDGTKIDGPIELRKGLLTKED